MLAGPLRLGVIPTIGPYLLPQVLPRLHASYPGVQLSLHESQTEHLLEALVAGDLDLLILALPVGRDDVATQALFDDAFNLAVAADHPLARRAAVSQQDLLAERLLLLEEGHCLREQALSLCHAAGANQADDFRASSLATVVQMVVNGYGGTILPDLALPVEAGAQPAAARGAVPRAGAGAHDRSRLARLVAARSRISRPSASSIAARSASCAAPERLPVTAG